MPTWPVSAGRHAMARAACQPLDALCIEEPPTMIIAGRVLAYRRARSTMRPAGMPVIPAAHAGVCAARWAAGRSQPVGVRAAKARAEEAPADGPGSIGR